MDKKGKDAFPISISFGCHEHRNYENQLSQSLLLTVYPITWDSKSELGLFIPPQNSSGVVKL